MGDIAFKARGSGETIVFLHGVGGGAEKLGRPACGLR